MNNPYAIPKLAQLEIVNEVSAGVRRLPGESGFDKPSYSITTTIMIVDMIPRIEVYDKRDSGKNTIGIKLRSQRSMGQVDRDRGERTEASPILCKCQRYTWV